MKGKIAPSMMCVDAFKLEDTLKTFKEEKIDYKDVAKLKRFMTEKGKILPRRQTGVCAYHQRELSDAIKRARVMALLPFVAD